MYEGLEEDEEGKQEECGFVERREREREEDEYLEEVREPRKFDTRLFRMSLL